MKCPNCGNINRKVVDSRLVQEGKGKRRRSQCLSCNHLWTTYEYEMEEVGLLLYEEHKKKVNALAKMILEFQRMFSDQK